MIDVTKQLPALSIPPPEAQSYNEWLKAADALKFLQQNARDDEFVMYAALSHTYINTVTVPLSLLDPPDKQDLMGWNYSPTSSWGITYQFSEPPEVWISPPLDATGSKTIDGGEQLLFSRYFEGHLGEKNYIEILQKFVHIFNVHFVFERNAFCRLDNSGDVEDVIRIVNTAEGVVVTCKRDLLDQYMALTDSALVRMFDFTRWRKSKFNGWSALEPSFTDQGDVFYKQVVEQDHASYTRGCQIVYSGLSKQDVAKLQEWGNENERKYETFIAHDWKNGVVRDISTAPDATANYFTKSDLPFGTSPAFFRPEVLVKYKSDSEKYRLEDRSIYCRGTWHLKTYDINEAGQVHTYIVYLQQLPHEEQLHWKAYNEEPKGPISRRAFKSDFEGKWDDEYDPLSSLKHELQQLADNKVGWWVMRSGDLMGKVHYPATTSADEWSNDILQLDQLVVEGFEKKWLRLRAVELKRNIDPQLGSLKVTEECLMGLGYDEGDARKVTAPLHELHDLRSKLKGHAGGKTAVEIKKRVLREHKTYKAHFRNLVTQCDESMKELKAALSNK